MARSSVFSCCSLSPPPSPLQPRPISLHNPAPFAHAENAFKAETRDSYGAPLQEGFIGDKNAKTGALRRVALEDAAARCSPSPVCASVCFRVVPRVASSRYL